MNELMKNTSYQIAVINFHGQQILSFCDGTTVRVAMRPIVENIGLAWGAQYRKIMNNQILNESVLIMSTPFDPNGQNMLTLPLNLLRSRL